MAAHGSGGRRQSGAGGEQTERWLEPVLWQTGTSRWNGTSRSGLCSGGLEKNLFGPGVHYSLLRLLLVLALLYEGAGRTGYIQYPVYLRVGSGMGKFLLSPIAIAMIGLMLLCSGVACLWRAGLSGAARCIPPKN